MSNKNILELIEQLASASVADQVDAYRNLSYPSDEIVDALIQGLKIQSNQVQGWILLLLQNSKDHKVYQTVLNYLSNFGDIDINTVPLIHTAIQVLKKFDKNIRFELPKILGMQKIQPLVSIVHDDNLMRDDEQNDNRILAVEVLANIADPLVLETLIYILELGEYPELCYAAAKALGDLGDEEALPALTHASNNATNVIKGGGFPANVRDAAREAIAKINFIHKNKRSIMSKTRRVVVTGMGVITPVGLTVGQFWQGLLSGQSGAGPITRFDTTGYDTTFACEVKGFDPLNYIERKLAQHLDLYTQFALAAASEALQDAGLLEDRLSQEERDLFGVTFGSCIGGMTTLQKQIQILTERGPSRISPFAVPMFLSNMAGAHISMRYGLRGPCYSPVSACATGNDSIGAGFGLIRDGDANIMLCGGSEAGICEIGVGSFNAMKALSRRNDDPKTASRPFDADRDGFVMGEGAGVVILEELEHAQRRNARIYAEVLSVGQAADAYHMTMPNADGQERAIKAALRKAGLQIEEVDYINMHATSTMGDAVETQAVKQVFGEQAARLNCSSTKSATGHLLGAAGVVEAIASILAMVYDTIPPTINLQNPDPACDLNYTPNQPVERKVNVALNNAFGFGGHSSCVALKKAVNL